MSKLTLDAAIKYCLEVADKNETKALSIEGTIIDRVAKDCTKCAADHRQLAEWLTELKERRAADVQPIRRGRWIEKSEDYYRQWQDSGRSWDDMPYFITGIHFACGVCFDKYEINAEGVEFWDFCPHCGADMRGEDNG